MSFSYFAPPPGPKRKKKSRPVREQAARPPLPELVAGARKEISDNDWSKKTQRIIRQALSAVDTQATINVLLCLGLGSPHSSINARLQLALLLDLCECFSIDPSRVAIYDPVFVEEDLKLLKGFKFNVLPEGKHECVVLDQLPTLLYMPHCDKHLYESILRSNWTPHVLPNVLFLTNRLKDYVENNPKRVMLAESPHLLKIAPTLHYHALEVLESHPTAFNDIGVQYVEATAFEAIYNKDEQEGNIGMVLLEQANHSASALPK
jgi:hypothetical protein